MTIFLLGVSGCNDVDDKDIDNKEDYGSSYDEADPNVTKKTVTDSPGTLFYHSEYKMFGVYSSKSPDADDNGGITIDTQYIYLIKGLKEKLPEDIEKKVTFSGKYYPSGIVYPISSYTIFYITDIVLNYE
jgi:hypothetical protein